MKWLLCFLAAGAMAAPQMIGNSRYRVRFSVAAVEVTAGSLLFATEMAGL